MSQMVSRTLGWWLLLLVVGGASRAWADFVIVANRTSKEVSFATEPMAGAPRAAHRLRPRELIVLPATTGLQLFLESPVARQYELAASRVYFFGETGNELELQLLDLGLDAAPAASTALAASELAEVPVRIFADEEEPGAPKAWERRLRQRVAAASEMLEKYCRLRLVVVGVGTWTSDNNVRSLNDLLREFETQVDPGAAMLAIGFTGQPVEPDEEHHLGGTRGVLRRHILVREWSASMSEAEKLEVLLHELGHVLGAAHSPEPDSVMRAQLGDGRARRRDFRIGFDPVSTLAINLVAGEIRQRKVTHSDQLSPSVREQLTKIYAALGGNLPTADNSTSQLRTQVRDTPATSLAQAARRIVGGVVQAGQQRTTDPGLPQKGDALTEYYVRAAARAAADLPYELAPAALLIGLGIALDDSDTLISNPLTRGFTLQVETEAERAQRRGVLGSPTVRGRRDLAQHFFLSGLLAAMGGRYAAETAGLAKEVADARSGSGFSYADLAADYAGIWFAESLLSRRHKILALAADFRTEDFMPVVADLPEGLKLAEWQRHSVAGSESPYERLRREILQRIAALPTHRP